EQIGRFYDTFIGPRQITFHRDRDLVDGETVVRDLTLEVVMASGLTMNIPAFLRYDLRPVAGDWKIASLRAYWELPVMVAVMLKQGAKAVPTSLQLAAGLLRHQGPAGTTGFLSGFRGAGRREKARIGELLAQAPDDRLRDARWLKVIAAGDALAASITTPTGSGVVICDIDAATRGIAQTRYFPHAPNV
ncbi:MAG: transporter, partial [Mycobacteriaceae bacterium]|nr:transporter [Mycobacteriaceae bacterium]